MGGGVDALGQPTHHGPTGFGQGHAEGSGHGQPMAGGPTGSHHRHRQTATQARPEGPMAAPVECQGWPIQLEQGGREGRIARQQHGPPRAELGPRAGKGVGTPTLAMGAHLEQNGPAHSRHPGQPLQGGTPGSLQITAVALEGRETAPAHPWTGSPELPPQTPGLAPAPAPLLGQPREGIRALGKGCPSAEWNSDQIPQAASSSTYVP